MCYGEQLNVCNDKYSEKQPETTLEKKHDTNVLLKTKEHIYQCCNGVVRTTHSVINNTWEIQVLADNYYIGSIYVWDELKNNQRAPSHNTFNINDNIVLKSMFSQIHSFNTLSITHIGSEDFSNNKYELLFEISYTYQLVQYSRHFIISVSLSGKEIENIN
jgi:hypothetical protein